MIDLKFTSNSQTGRQFQQLNVQFFKHLLAWINAQDDVNFYDKLIKTTKIIKNQLAQLSPEQQSEWAYHITTKIKQLASSSTSHTTQELLEKLYVLVDCAKRLNIPYQYEKIHNLIKQTYYEVYKEKIVPLFKKTGFDVQQFQVLEYQDPWYSRMWRTIFQ